MAKYTKKVTKKVYKKKPAKKTSGMNLELLKLKRQVARLTKVAINKIQYRTAFNMNCYDVAGLANYQARNLVKFSDWTRIFGTDADDEVNKQAIVRSITGRWSFLTNEPDDRRYSMWIVSLKDNASELLTAGTGDLGTLVEDTHFIGSGDRVLLNLKFFNVHYHKTWHAGVYPMSKAAGPSSSAAVQNIPNTGTDSIKQGRYSIKCGKAGMKVLNPKGDWKAQGYPRDPSQNYFLLTFWSGDSIADVEYGTVYTHNLYQVEVSG